MRRILLCLVPSLALAGGLYPLSDVRVVDGDTVDAVIELGFGVRLHERIRLEGIDAPERYTEDGKRATARLREWLALCGMPLTLKSSGREKFGRVLGRVLCGPVDASQMLLEAGLAREYHGGRR